MVEEHTITPRLSERFSDLFGVDELSKTLSDDAPQALVYLEESRKLSLNKLLHLVPYSEVLLLLGDAGVGRTTLLRSFIERSASTWRISFVGASALMDTATFLRQIAKGFEFELDNTDSVDDLLWEVNRYLQALGRSGRRAIIIVDDAHLLADEVLLLAEKILRDEHGDHNVSLLLSMRRELAARLVHFALLHERLAYTLTLEPFNKKEVAGYLRHRLAGSAADLDALLTPELVAQIQQESGGLPDEINRIVHALLTQRKPAKVAKPDQVPAAPAGRRSLLGPVLMGVVGLAGGLMLYYQDEINALLTPPVQEQQAQLSEAEAPAVAMVEPAPAEPLPLETALAAPEAPPALAEEAVPAAEEVAPASAATMPATAPVEAAPVAETPVEPAVLAEAPKTEPAKVEPTPEKVKTQSAVPGLLPGIQWLMQQPDGNYTMQLMALDEEEKVRRYARNWKIGEQSAVYPITRRGNVFFVLVYGSYASKAEAMKAAANLPKSWRVKDAWVRSLAEVKRDVAQN